MISIIIPVYNEQAVINDMINQLLKIINHDIEIIIVDGNGNSTIELLEEKPPLKLITSSKGRGMQMNTGAKYASGEILLFLHIDTKLPPKAIEIIIKSNAEYGAFDLTIDSPKFIFRIIEWIASKRSRITNIPYGDQAVFIKQCYFKQIGGFSNVSIMEDIIFARELKKIGLKPYICRFPVQTSARRWEKEGIVFGTLRNWILICAFLLGVKPNKLAKWYK